MCLGSPRIRIFPVLYVLALTAPHESAGQGSVFKTGVEMVALTVTVTDAKGQCMSGLSASDFAVFEDGIQQTVSLFGSEEIRVDVALILDTSSSMINALPIAKTAARALVDRLRPADRAALIDVKGSTTIPLPFTDDRGRVAAAVTAMSARGTTALYDGVYVSLREFERERRQRPEIRRHALVVLSDGVDTSSHVTFDDVAHLARTLDVTIYTIALRDSVSTATAAPEDPVRRANWEMRTLAAETGGLVFFPSTAADLSGVYEVIARELTNQYALGYVSSAPRQNGAFKRVTLRLVPPAQGRARTRTGYVASGPAVGGR